MKHNPAIGFLSGGLVLAVVLMALSASSCFAASNGNDNDKSLFDMSLEELMNMSVTSGTLTDTTRRYTPSAITVIDQKMIQSSGARSVDELLDIYVPNFQLIKHHFYPMHAGLRGLNDDTDGKWLLLVNGRVMNNRLAVGAVSERDLVMLDDIHHIDVVRGPGSAMYGTGAISMVVNIITENANTFQGTKLTTKVGFIEEYYSVEYKHGKMLDDETGLYVYVGIADYIGADQKWAPLVYGTDFNARWESDSTTVSAEQGEPVDSYSVNKDQEAYRKLPKWKIHGEITKENFNFWVRYTRGGTHNAWSQFSTARWTAELPAGEHSGNRSDYYQIGLGYQQLTVYTKFHQDISDTFGLDYIFSYDLFDFERPIHATNIDLVNGKPWHFSNREDEYLFKILSKWNPHEDHSVAIGVERSWEIFGLKSIGFPDSQPTWSTFGRGVDVRMDRWSTNTDSLFGEYQWRHSEKWRTFWGIRLDKNSYTDETRSPRVAAIYTPNDKDTYKFMYSRSIRQSFADRSRVAVRDNNERTKPEILDSYEFRFERQQTKNLQLATSIFYNQIDIAAWGGSTYTIVGEMDLWGIEFEDLYSTDRWKLQLSHSYTKMKSFDLADPGITDQVITAAPYDFGNDLAMWASHSSKIYAKYKINDKWSADGSVRAYWNFQGSKDMVDYRQSVVVSGPGSSAPGSAVTFRNPGYNDPFGATIFLNLGLDYKASENLTWRLDGHNLLGFIDHEFNKRLFLQTAAYRSHAPSFSLSLRYKF